MTYTELISQFEVFDNPPKKDGYHRHHIVPECEQKKMYGSVTDNRQIYCSLPMHMWLHILYDREHDTNTAYWFLKLCGKPAEYFDCWEKCLAYSYTLRKKMELKDKNIRGKNTWSKGQKWFNDGTKNVRAYSCPEGFVPGICRHA